MASGQTSRYGLSQWQPEDKVLREEFNGDNSKVDAALGGLADQMGTKAGQADLDGVKTQLATKAAQSALDSLSAMVTAGLAKKYGTDNPYIKAGDYTGDGATVKTITLGFRPSLVMVFSVNDGVSAYSYLFLLGDPSAHIIVPQYKEIWIRHDWLTFSNNGFTIEHKITNYDGFNNSGWKYHYLAFR